MSPHLLIFLLFSKESMHYVCLQGVCLLFLPRIGIILFIVFYTFGNICALARFVRVPVCDRLSSPSMYNIHTVDIKCRHTPIQKPDQIFVLYCRSHINVFLKLTKTWHLKRGVSTHFNFHWMLSRHDCLRHIAPCSWWAPWSSWRGCVTRPERWPPPSWLWGHAHTHKKGHEYSEVHFNAFWKWLLFRVWYNNGMF